MERGSLEKLKFDKRLQLRQGWVSEQDTEGYLESLPDVSDKIAVESEEQEEQQQKQQQERQQAAAAREETTASPGDTPAAPAGGLGERTVDPLSPPPFKEV